MNVRTRFHDNPSKSRCWCFSLVHSGGPISTSLGPCRFYGWKWIALTGLIFISAALQLRMYVMQWCDVKAVFSVQYCSIHNKVLFHTFLHNRNVCARTCVAVCVLADNFSSWGILLLSSPHSLTSVKWLPLIMPLTTALQFSGAQWRDWE